MTCPPSVAPAPARGITARPVADPAGRRARCVPGGGTGPAACGARWRLSPARPRARAGASRRRGRCRGAVPAVARARCRARSAGHGPAGGRVPPRGPDPGPGPGPACPSTTTDHPRPAHGRPAPSWRAVVPRHPARRAARRHRHCGVHRSPLHSRPGRTTVPVERRTGRPRPTAGTALLPPGEAGPEDRPRRGGPRPLPRPPPTAPAARPAPGAAPVHRGTGRRHPYSADGVEGPGIRRPEASGAGRPSRTAAGVRHERIRRADSPAGWCAPAPSGPRRADADHLAGGDAGVVGDRGEEDHSCP